MVTIGGGTSETVAKIASRVAKPDGLLLVKPGEERSFLSPLAAGPIMMGPQTEELLKWHGVLTIGDMANCDEAWLARVLGNRGLDLWQRSRGIDDAPVTNLSETKSVSAETIMAVEVDSEAVLVGHIEHLARHLSGRLEKGGLRGTTVYVKLRLSDFTTFTRQMRLGVPTWEAEVVSQAACSLLERELKPGRKFRLIGVGVRNFQGGFQLPLIAWELGAE